MTRDEILSMYAVENNMIVSPGKFEGEPIYAPYFSEFAGDGEELAFLTCGGVYAALIELIPADRKEWPELTAAKYIFLSEDDRGFVYVAPVYDEAHADELRSIYASAIAAEEAAAEAELAAIEAEAVANGDYE